MTAKDSLIPYMSAIREGRYKDAIKVCSYNSFETY